MIENGSADLRSVRHVWVQGQTAQKIFAFDEGDVWRHPGHFRDFLSSDRPVIQKPGSHLNSNFVEGNGLSTWYLLKRTYQYDSRDAIRITLRCLVDIEPSMVQEI